MAECPDTIEELEAWEQRLTLCRKDIYERTQAKIKAGAASSKYEAHKQISEETGRPFETIRKAHYREEQSRESIQNNDNGTLSHPPCETGLQVDVPACPLPHVAQNTGENEWYTPPEFIEAARAVMGGIDCDPASSEIANKTVKAERFFTATQDGRDKKWGARVWMNPPYAQPLIADFSEGITFRIESGQVKEACVLVNNATETGWFQRMMGIAAAVAFVKSRVRFLDPEGNPGAPLQGQCVLYFGNNIDVFCQEFKKFGIVLIHANL